MRRPQDLRALRANAFVIRRPPTPWLLIAFDRTLELVSKAPRHTRAPLLYLVLFLSELLPIRLLLMQEMMMERLYPEPAQS